MPRVLASVKMRAAAGATVIVAAALVVTGVILLQLLHKDLAKQADRQAAAAAHAVAQQLQAGTDPEDITLSAVPIQITDTDGKPIPSGGEVGPSWQPGASAAPVTPLDHVPVETTPANQGRTTDAPENFRWSAAETSVVNGHRVTVYAAASMAAERSAVRTVRIGMIAGLPPLLALTGLLTWLVAGRALRPVEAIRSEMAAITSSSELTRRVPVPASRDEIARLATATNDTLAALEASVEQQRHFVADASHELRNPVASLRAQLEIGARHPELLDLDDAIADTVRLQTLLADLLLLAHLDADETRAGWADVNLLDLVRDQTADRDAVWVGPVTDPTDPTGLWVEGSAGQLGRVLTNLLDNAQRHAAHEVVVSSRLDGADAVIAVADDGDGVPDEQRERIFERFVRLDSARSREDGGSGLGLAIAREIVEHHRGTLSVTSGSDGGAVFEIRLPVKTAPGSAGLARDSDDRRTDPRG